MTTKKALGAQALKDEIERRFRSENSPACHVCTVSLPRPANPRNYGGRNWHTDVIGNCDMQTCLSETARIISAVGDEYDLA